MNVKMEMFSKMEYDCGCMITVIWSSAITMALSIDNRPGSAGTLARLAAVCLSDHYARDTSEGIMDFADDVSNPPNVISIVQGYLNIYTKYV